MKVRRFITTCGVLIGAALITGITAKGASATLTYEKSSDVQFTFEPMLDLDLSETSGASDPCGLTTSPAYCITGLAPGNIGVSNVVNAKVTSNNVAGWTLYATVGGASKEPSGPTYADQKLVLIGATGDDFDMIGSSATTLSAGEWGYTLDGGTTYMDLPYYTTTAPKIINATVDSAGNPATGYAGDTTNDGTDTQIGAYADASQISGTYGNVINFTATANIPSHQVTVVAGSGVDTVSLNGSTTTLTGTFAEGDNTVAIAATCTTGNNFAGWNVTPQFGILADRDAASTTFTVGANDVTITATCGYNVMQNFSAAGMSTGDTAVVQDLRDGQMYTVAKLADGNVWMMTNLNLGDIDNYPLQVANLDSSNTNIVTPVAAATFNSWKKSSGTATYTAAELIPVSGTDATSQTPYGTLYNYCAASGGDSRACVSDMSSQLSPSYDICPKGWRLPTGGSSGEFQTLYSNSAYNTNAKMRAPYTSGGAAFALAGYFRNSTPTDQGSYGGYWSSTRRSSTDMYRLYLSTSDVDPANNSGRYDGRSIRCVLK